MASTTKKGSKNDKAKPRGAAVKTPSKRVQTNAELHNSAHPLAHREIVALKLYVRDDARMSTCEREVSLSIRAKADLD